MKLLVLVFLVIALVAFVAALRKARGRSGVDLHLIVFLKTTKEFPPPWLFVTAPPFSAAR